MPRRRIRAQFRRRPFAPAEPPIVEGKFAGRKLSELSDEELNLFLRADARHQHRTPITVSGWPFPPRCPDLSQYWFAKYELERRKPEAHRESAASLKIAAGDTMEDIAWKLTEYGFRAASRKYHPDRGGDTRTMPRVNEAREFAQKRLKELRRA